MSSEITVLPELMTVAEVARLWRQRRETVYRKIAAGELRAVRLGDETAALRIPRREIERIYEISTVGGGSSVDSGTAVGRSSSLDDPAERDGTSGRREAVEPAQLAGRPNERRTNSEPPRLSC
jgi:excisionase family DNA binding protein